MTILSRGLYRTLLPTLVSASLLFSGILPSRISAYHTTQTPIPPASRLLEERAGNLYLETLYNPGDGNLILSYSHNGIGDAYRTVSVVTDVSSDNHRIVLTNPLVYGVLRDDGNYDIYEDLSVDGANGNETIDAPDGKEPATTLQTQSCAPREIIIGNNSTVTVLHDCRTGSSTYEFSFVARIIKATRNYFKLAKPFLYYILGLDGKYTEFRDPGEDGVSGDEVPYIVETKTPTPSATPKPTGTPRKSNTPQYRVPRCNFHINPLCNAA